MGLKTETEMRFETRIKERLLMNPEEEKMKEDQMQETPTSSITFVLSVE